MRSQLARHLPDDPLDDEEVRDMARRLWRDRGVALIPLDEIANAFDRQAIINIANQLYGERA